MQGENTVIVGPFPGPEPERTEAWRGGAAYSFQPSPDVRKCYLSTRKHSFSLAEIPFFGLFTESAEEDLGI
jgi:hypothetical protein